MAVGAASGSQQNYLAFRRRKAPLSLVMIPVQVGTRIAYMVDTARAASMSRGVNVRTVRDRRSKSIVRLIIIPRELGNGSSEEPSQGLDSRKSTYVERLFTDHEPLDTMLSSDGRRVPRSKSKPLVSGYGFVYQFKPSSCFSTKSKSSGSKRAGRGGAPTTTASTARSGSITGGSSCP